MTDPFSPGSEFAAVARRRPAGGVARRGGAAAGPFQRSAALPPVGTGAGEAFGAEATRRASAPFPAVEDVAAVGRAHATCPVGAAAPDEIRGSAATRPMDGDGTGRRQAGRPVPSPPCRPPHPAGARR